MSKYLYVCNKCGKEVESDIKSIGFGDICECGGEFKDETISITVSERGREMTREEKYAPVVEVKCAICERRVLAEFPVDKYDSSGVLAKEIEGFVCIYGKNICDKCMGLIKEYLEGTVNWTVAKP